MCQEIFIIRNQLGREVNFNDVVELQISVSGTEV